MALVKSDYRIADNEVEIHAYPNGNWGITLGDEDIGYADTLEKAIARARTALAKQKVKVSVPFVTQDGERGIAHGLHAKTGKVLARVNDKPIDLGYKQPLRADIPQDVLDRYLELTETADAAYNEAKVIEREYRLDLSTAVRKAVADAAERAVAGETEAA